MLGVLVLLAFFVSACDSAELPQEVADEFDNVEVVESDDQSLAVQVDIDADGVMDAELSVVDDVVTAVVEYEAPVVDASVEYCVAGAIETFSFEGEGGSSDSIVIGLTQYKGKEMCQAESITKIDTPMGEIVTETVYYFDNTYSEFWVTTTTSGGPMPTPQVNEIHIVNGQVQ